MEPIHIYVLLMSLILIGIPVHDWWRGVRQKKIGKKESVEWDAKHKR